MNVARIQRIFLSFFYVSVGATIVAGQAVSPTSPKADETATARVSPPLVVVEKPVEPAVYSPSNLNRVGVQTAQPLPLTLSDAIRRALGNNNDVEISRDDVRFQETQVRGLEGQYDPVLTLQPNFTRNSTTGSSATNDFRVNSNFSQFVRKGGGSYQTFFNNSRTENQFAQAQVTSGNVSTGGSAIFSSSLGISFTQPLAKNLRIDSRRHSIIVAKKRLEQTDSDFRLRANETITAVSKAYWDFVFALRNQQNQVANVNLSKENLRQIEAKIEAGAAAPLERAEVSTELANREGELLLATQQVSIAENTLKQLILRDPLSVEWSQTFVPTDKPSFSLDAVNLDDAMKDAMDNRFELRRLKLQKEINDADIRLFRNQIKPQIDLNTTFSLDGFSRGGATTATTFVNGFSGNDEVLRTRLNTLLAPADQISQYIIAIPGTSPFLVGGFNRSWANMFRSDAPNYSVGVTFSFPFRNRTARADLAGAQIQQNQIDARLRGQEQAVVVEVRNAVQAVETTRQRVLTARRARENAEIQLDGERKLYESGRSTTFILFQRENSLTNARNAEIRAETDYNKALADLHKVTSTAFRANNIQVQSPLQK